MTGLNVSLSYDERASVYFFFHHPATTEIDTLSLHDALPISAGRARRRRRHRDGEAARRPLPHLRRARRRGPRSEEHTSELQSRRELVCRLRLEKKNTILPRTDHDVPPIPAPTPRYAPSAAPR